MTPNQQHAPEQSPRANPHPLSRIFIRDDDVGELTPALRGFHETFASRRIPVSYQIIPEKLTAECASEILAWRAANASLIEFGQHGLRHEMMVNGKREFYEFGRERSYDQQLADIAEGRAILQDRLGGDVAIRVFTPPRHRYDRNTLRALATSGFSILSASAYPGWVHRAAYAAGRLLGLTNIGRGGVSHHGRRRSDCGLFELSISVAVDDGSSIFASVDEIMTRVEAARRVTRDVGLMFHHHAYRQADGADFLARLSDRLTGLNDVSFHGISQLHTVEADPRPSSH